ncbi:ATP-binding cassette sub-family C member 4 [Culicoides brevitarsis]|uniref:ATP-binding cassette sub-family C member 4 n=1 Tax=Culicoides brevitarsis TaxID=469753 RepID=UPI00307BB600
MDNSVKPTKENPKKGSNPLSKLIFGWIFPLFFQGTRRGLNTDNLTKCLDKDESEMLGNKLEVAWDKEQEKARNKNREPQLRNALFQVFFKYCLFDGFLIFSFCLIKSFQPLVLAQLLLQFQKTNSSMPESTHNARLTPIHDDESMSIFVEEDSYPKIHSLEELSVLEKIFAWVVFAWNDVYWLTSLVVLMTLVPCFLAHHANLSQRMLGARMRIACCSAIYRKTLRMSKKSAGQTPIGYLVNLLSNDVSRFDDCLVFIHYVWILPFQSCIICYLLWREVRWAALVGVVGLLLKTIPVQTGLSRLSSVLRMKVAKRTDNRVGIMNEIIQGIQVIKMYAWETAFEKVVAVARKKEITQIKFASYIRGIYLSTMIFTERSTLLIAIATCVFMGEIPLTADIVFSMAQYFNILQLTAAIFYPMAVSLGAEALVSVKRVQEYLMVEEQDTVVVGLHKTERTPETPKDEPEVKIKNVTAMWDPNSDKKTLSELNIEIKSNKLCAIIGSVGAGKSSLLQLLLGELPIYAGDVYIPDSISYASQEPWLFTGTVRQNILFGLPYNRKRYRDVVTHCALLTDFEQLPNGDQTIIGDRGAALSGGQKARVNLARACYKEAQVYLLDDPLSAVDSHVGKHLFEQVAGPNSYLASQKATRILVTHQVHFLKEADWIVVLDEGKILMQGTFSDLAKSNLDLGKLVSPAEPDEEIPVVDESEDEEDDIPYIDGVSRNGYLALGSNVSLSRSKSMSKSMSFGNLGSGVAAEQQAEGGISFYVWSSYFRAGANICVLLLLLLVLIGSQAVTSGSDYFVNIWTQQEYLRHLNQTTIFSTYECLYIYTGLICGVIFMTCLRGWLFFNICMAASRTLHNRMFACLLRAPMQFFDTNPGGRILNRFSKDMGAIDELLPRAMMDALQIGLVMIGILVLISIVNPLLLVPLAVTIVLFCLVLKLYLRPAQDLKRLEGICRSPVFSHLAATLNGISTIRANQAQNKVSTEFDALQDVHSAIWQLTISSNTALGLWLDCVSTTFVACVAFSFIVLHQTTFSGNVGLAISQALILTGMVQYGIRQTTESIQQMTCVERVLQYSNIESEVNPKKVAPKDWPWKAEIQFKDMSLSYGKSSPVLKNLNLKIESAWKVGIVGRTGAGKSSLIGALFRLANIEGKILIDGIDTGVISLDSLREKISIIPQDPVLFSATIRYNLDPFNKYEDDALWQALEAVELKSSIHGLHFMVSEGGSNFSVGQRQLLCLARAILRGNKILVLDEATANVDPQTDALIQTTIRDKFRSCTVLTVAHRLHTVMDSDRILVMENGYAKEFDVPHLLLQQEGSILLDMVEATGPQESGSLKQIAEDSYVKMQLLDQQSNLFKFE